jgi:hypothetical protein
MTKSLDVDDLVNKFRLASRELFNHFFRVPNPYDGDEGWEMRERFLAVQSVLFQKLVTEPAGLPSIKYGDPQTNITVKIRVNENVPVMLNREISSGYWDHPVKEATQEASFCFLAFFDWDQLGYQDNRHVRVRVDRWPSHPEVIGKHALIDCQYIRFVKT